MFNINIWFMLFMFKFVYLNIILKKCCSLKSVMTALKEMQWRGFDDGWNV